MNKKSNLHLFEKHDKNVPVSCCFSTEDISTFCSALKVTTFVSLFRASGFSPFLTTVSNYCNLGTAVMPTLVTEFCVILVYKITLLGLLKLN